LKKYRRKAMELFYWIGGVLAAGLFVYLMIALLKPEAFS
jgi:K+-transporting ATPase KdpF subunit